MSFESHEKARFDEQSDAFFECTSDMSTTDRIGMVALELVDFINEERLAQDEILNEGIEIGKGAQKVARETKPLMSHLAFDSFIAAAFGQSGTYVAFEPTEKEPSHNEDASIRFPDDITRLQSARMGLVEMKVHLSYRYALTFRQMNKAEAQARQLKTEN